MIHLKPADKSDAHFLAALEAEVMQAHATALWGHYQPAELSSFDIAATRVIYRADRQIGYATVEVNPDHLHLRKLYLTPAAQGGGIGAEVLAMIQTEATAIGLPLRLSVLTPNSRALAFYLREGLQVAETTPERIFLQSA